MSNNTQSIRAQVLQAKDELLKMKRKELWLFAQNKGWNKSGTYFMWYKEALLNIGIDYSKAAIK